MSIALAVLVWLIVGLIVCESCRIWTRMWWLEPSIWSALLWPVVLLSAVFGDD